MFRDVYIAAGAALFLGLLLALALIDAEHRILPNAVVYPAMAGFAVGIGAGAVFGQRIDWLTAVIGFIAFGGVLFVIAIVVPNGMGMGDVKLAGLIGLALGGLGLRYVAVAAGTAVLAGGLGAIVALMAKRSRKATIPFGPFACRLRRTQLRRANGSPQVGYTEILDPRRWDDDAHQSLTLLRHPQRGIMR